MKYIEKQAIEPTAITNTKASGGTFDDLDKEEVQHTLLREQGHICAYCMRRISREWNTEANKRKIEIEHFLPQESYPDRSLDYKNMLGVCNGKSGKFLHCDKTQGGKADGKVELNRLNPLDKSCETLLKYLDNGTIISSADESNVEEDINKILHLNNEKLKEYRADALERAWTAFKNKHKKHKGTWTKKMFQDEIDKLKQPDNSGKYKEYCQFLIYFFEKKAKQAIKN